MAQDESAKRKPSAAFQISPDRLESLRGELASAVEAGLDIADWRLKRKMAADGAAWTRDNYIRYRGRDEFAEIWDESELPDDLQDWSKGAP